MEEKPDILDLLREWHDVDPERAATLFQAIEEITELRRQLQEDKDFFRYLKLWLKRKLNV